MRATSGLLDQEVFPRRQHCCHGAFWLEKDASAGFAEKSAHPRLDRPSGIQFSLLKEQENVWIGRREDARVAADQGDADPIVDQPGSALDVLGIAQLRCGNRLVTKVLDLRDGVSADDQRLAASHRPCHDPYVPTVGPGIRVDRRAWPHVSEIDRAGKNRLHCRRPSVEDEPFNRQADPFLKPAPPLSAKTFCHERMGMRDVRKKPNPQALRGRRE